MDAGDDIKQRFNQPWPKENLTDSECIYFFEKKTIFIEVFGKDDTHVFQFTQT